MLDLSIVIVNYNTSKLLDECLGSVKAETNVSFEIIVIDNASQDDSVTMLKLKHPDVTLIQNKKNDGFALANNQGFDIAKGRYFLMLNPDTVVLDKALDKLVSYMDLHPAVGICSPRNEDVSGDVQFNCDHYPSVLNDIFMYLNIGIKFPNVKLFKKARMLYWDYNEIKSVDRVMGCSLLIPAGLYRQVGGLDNEYFMYFEETDLCYRIKKLGYKIMFIPSAAIIHYGGASSISQNEYKVINKTVLAYFLKSKFYFFKKNYGIINAIFSRFVDSIFSLGILLQNAFRNNKELKKTRVAKARAQLECFYPKISKFF